MKKKISANKLKKMKASTLSHFPRYTTYLINQAAGTGQATRPKVVGQLSDEFPLYIKYCEENNLEQTVDNWKEYHQKKYPNAVENAVKKTSDMIENFRNAVTLIDNDLIEEWIVDLLYEKTFFGFNIEYAIRKYIEEEGHQVRKATKEEESQNIDLYIDGNPFQIKPMTIKTKRSIETIIVHPIIYYTKTDQNGIEIEYDD
jgi:hypothetical protein